MEEGVDEMRVVDMDGQLNKYIVVFETRFLKAKRGNMSACLKRGREYIIEHTCPW